MGFDQQDPSSNDSPPERESDFLWQRERMIRDQLRGRDVRDENVLAAMLKVCRHRFVPDAMESSAYQDTPLPIMLGQTISQPYIVGYMTQLLQLRGPERVLEIGTGSGYQAAVLAELAQEVFTIEILPELAARARARLDAIGYGHVHTRWGDGYSGWVEASPFDRIIVTAAPDHVPQPLIDQLATGGKLVVPVGSSEQELVVLEKSAAGLTRRKSIPVRFVPMTGVAAGQKLSTGSR